MSLSAARILCVFCISIGTFPGPPVTAQEKVVRADSASSKLRGQLPNGIKYYIENSGSQDSGVRLVVSVRAGVDVEEASERGLAHLVEHLGFPAWMAEVGQSAGIPKGNGIGAHTFHGTINYYINVPPGSTLRSTDLSRILRYWCGNEDVSDSFIEKEMLAVKAEGTSLSDLALDNWAFKSILGIGRTSFSEENAKLDPSIRPEDARAFRNRWYVPQRISVAVVGDVNLEEWQNAIEASLSALPKRSDAPVPGEPERGELPAGLSAFKIEGYVDQSIRLIAFSRDAEPSVENSSAQTRRQLVEDILAAALSRTATKQSEAIGKRINYTIYRAFDYLPWRQIVARMEGNDPALIADLAASLARLKRFGLDDRDIEKAKLAVADSLTENGGVMTPLAGPPADAVRYAENLGKGVEPRAGAPLSIAKRRAIIASVTPNEINRSLSQRLKHLDNAKLIVSVGGGSPGRISDDSASQQLLVNAISRAPTRLANLEDDIEFLSDLKPQTLARAKPGQAQDLNNELRLRNGATVSFRSLKSEAPRGTVRIVAIGNPFKSNGLSRKFSLEPQGPANGFNAVIRYIRENGLRTEFETTPNYSAVMISGGRGRLESQMDAMRSVLRRKAQGNIAWSPSAPFGELIPSCTSSSDGAVATSVAKSDYYRFVPHSFVVLGQFDSAEARQLAIQYLDDLQAGDRIDLIAGPSMNLVPAGCSVAVPQPDTSLEVWRTFSAEMPVTPDLYDRVEVLQQLMQILIGNELRLNIGGSYYNGSSIKIIRDGCDICQVRAGMYFISDQNMSKTYENGIDRVIVMIRSGNFSREQLESAKKLASFQLESMKGDRDLATQASLELAAKGRTIDISQLGASVPSIISSDIRDLFRKLEAGATQPR